MKIPKIIEVEWMDASALPHWQDEGDIPELTKCHTVGYILRDTKRTLTLALTYSNDKGTISPLTIPQVCVTKRRRLK